MENVREVLSYVNSLQWSWSQVALAALALLVLLVALWVLFWICAAPFRLRALRTDNLRLKDALAAAHEEVEEQLRAVREEVRELADQRRLTAEVEEQLGIRLLGQLDQLPAGVQSRIDAALAKFVDGELAELCDRGHPIGRQILDVVAEAVAQKLQQKLTALPDISIVSVLGENGISELAKAIVEKLFEDVDEDDLEELQTQVLTEAKSLVEGEDPELVAVIRQGLCGWIGKKMRSILDGDEDGDVNKAILGNAVGMLNAEELDADVAAGIRAAVISYLHDNGKQVIVDDSGDVDSAMVERAKQQLELDPLPDDLLAAVRKSVVDYLDEYEILKDNEDVEEAIRAAAKKIVGEAIGDPAHPAHAAVVKALQRHFSDEEEE